RTAGSPETATHWETSTASTSATRCHCRNRSAATTPARRASWSGCAKSTNGRQRAPPGRRRARRWASGSSCSSGGKIMLELYHWEPNTYYLKPLIALHEKQAAFTSRWFDPTAFEHFAPSWPGNTESS